MLEYGTSTITYALTYTARKTLGITVHPDLRVTVAAPEGTAFADIEAKVRQRAAWILAQQRDLERYLPQLPPRQYVSGESHRYLGRQYRLKVVLDQRAVVQRSRQFLYVHTPTGNPGDVRDLLLAWYHARAEIVFAERLAACYPKTAHLGIPTPELQLRVLKNRWGSTKDNVITLNPKLIQASEDLIDYVILHELCHLVEPNHSARFYALLRRVLPDWEARKDALEMFDFG